MPDSKAAFVQAVHDDEYSDFGLPSGDVLITDWRVDDAFHPYVVPRHRITDRDVPTADEIEARVRDAVAGSFPNTRVYFVEVSYDRAMVHVSMDKPPRAEA